MRSASILLVLLTPILVFSAPGQAFAMVSADEARHRAQELIDDIAAYSERHPQAPAARLDWLGASAGSPVLVHGYTDGVAHYYLVAVETDDEQIVSSIAIDAITGRWQQYTSFVARRSLLAVGRSEARARLKREFGLIVELDAVQLSMLPNKTLYWHCRITGADVTQEYFVNANDPADIHTHADIHEAGLTRAIHTSEMPLDDLHFSDRVSPATDFPASHEITD
ncbi:MAG: hypothetical protein JSV80_04850, partial [Acidobacteriota bacterium]